MGASVFVELNQQAVLPLVYGAQHQALVERWRGHRVLAIDSSVVRLPKSAEVGQRFGWMEYVGEDGQAQERYPQGRLSVLYDVLNQVALEGRLEPWKVAEEELAHQHLARLSLLEQSTCRKWPKTASGP